MTLVITGEHTGLLLIIIAVLLLIIIAIIIKAIAIQHDLNYIEIDKMNILELYSLTLGIVWSLLVPFKALFHYIAYRKDEMKRKRERAIESYRRACEAITTFEEAGGIE